jgi:hypothetical protein
LGAAGFAELGLDHDRRFQHDPGGDQPNGIVGDALLEGVGSLNAMATIAEASIIIQPGSPLSS